MKALAKVSIDSPEFISALKNSRAANKEADKLLKKQRDVIRAIRR